MAHSGPPDGAMVPPWNAELHRLVSLLEIMLSDYGRRLAFLQAEIDSHRRDLREKHSSQMVKREPFRKSLSNSFLKAREICDELQLESAGTCVANFLSDLRNDEISDETARQYLAELDRDLCSDLGKVYFLSIRKEKKRFYETGFSEEINFAFPSAALEIREANACFAVERNTACVFHLMRGVEFLLRALADAVGVQERKSIPLEYETWNHVIEKIENRIRDAKLENWSRPAKTKARDILGGSLADFHYFKDAVRDCCMHTRSGLYDEHRALSYRNRVETSFERLLPYLNENESTPLLVEARWQAEKP